MDLCLCVHGGVVPCTQCVVLCARRVWCVGEHRQKSHDDQN